MVCNLNVDLKLTYVASRDNTADAPSRSLTPQDATLALPTWRFLEARFGPHTVDMMALDSNAMCGADGEPLPHFTPCPLPGSSGVNVFSQVLCDKENYYVFPPFVMIPNVLGFLKEFKGQGIKCTIVVNKSFPLPSWWTSLSSLSVCHLLLAKEGECDVIKYPTKKGWESRQLMFDLYAFRLIL